LAKKEKKPTVKKSVAKEEKEITKKVVAKDSKTGFDKSKTYAIKDAIKIAREIDKKCKDIGKVMPILIEINSGKEPNKDGVMPENVESLIKQISILPNIQVKGLMTMAPYFDDPEKDRPYFKLTKG